MLLAGNPRISEFLFFYHRRPFFTSMDGTHCGDYIWILRRAQTNQFLGRISRTSKLENPYLVGM